ncbi:hypothetical protein ACHAWF_007243 [Thalassiosira exigua]
MEIQHKPVDVGTPPSIQEPEITPIRFHGFKDLDTTRDSSVNSPKFSSLGHQWLIGLCPGGDGEADVGNISIYLANMSGESIEAECRFRIKRPKSTISTFHHQNGKVTFTPRGTEDSTWGIRNFVSRQSLIEGYLLDGTLVIEVWLKHANPSPPPPPFNFDNPFCGAMLKLFGDKDSSDIVFEVEDQSQKNKNTRKRARKSHIKFHAHRLVLKQCAPDLAALSGSMDGAVSVPITDVKPDIFRHLLYYIYGGKLTEKDVKTHARELINAADRYGIVGLKLEAEMWYVKLKNIDLENVMELLLYADAKNCALLKEATMDFIVENRVEVLQKVPLNNVPGGLFAELLAATTRKLPAEGEESDLSTLRISELRKKLKEKGLNLDGSREILIATLKENA